MAYDLRNGGFYTIDLYLPSRYANVLLDTSVCPYSQWNAKKTVMKKYPTFAFETGIDKFIFLAAHEFYHIAQFKADRRRGQTRTRYEVEFRIPYVRISRKILGNSGSIPAYNEFLSLLEAYRYLQYLGEISGDPHSDEVTKFNQQQLDV